MDLQFELHELPAHHPVRVPLARLQAAECAMSEFSLLLDSAEVLIKYGAAVVIAVCRRDLGTEEELQKSWGEILQGKPTLGQFVQILREGMKASPPALGKVCANWGNDGQACTDKILKYRNTIWGHGATLSHKEYAEMAEELADAVKKLRQILWPLCRLSLLWPPKPHDPSDQSAVGKKDLLPFFVQPENDPSSDPAKPLELSPLVCWHSPQVDGSYHSVFFNGTGKSGKSLGFLNYANGALTETPPEHPISETFRNRFGMPGKPPPPPVDYESQLEEAARFFCVRRQELQALQDFAKSDGLPRVLVVAGDPGMGKSTLMVELARHSGACLHLFEERNHDQCTELALCQNLGRRIRDRAGLPGFPFNDSPKPAKAWTQLKNTAAAAIEAGRGPRLMVIDGIDELLRANTKQSLGWLNHIKDFPPEFRWVFSCRHDVLERDDFKSVFPQRDSVVRMILPKLDHKSVETLIASRAPDILDGPDTNFSHLVEASEGNPLYLHLWLSDPARSKAQADALPFGLDQYYLRSVVAMENDWHARSQQYVKKALRELRKIASSRAAPEIREGLEAFFAQVEQELFTEKDNHRPLKILCLHATALRPISPHTTGAVLGIPEEEMLQVYEILRPSLRREQDGAFSLFHSAFKKALYGRFPQLMDECRVLWARWCGNVLTHQNSYALRHAINHLQDAADIADAETALSFRQTGHRFLTSLEYIEKRRHRSELAGLIDDYALMGEPPRSVTGGRTLQVVSSLPSWLQECQHAVLKGHDVHLDKGSGPLLRELRRNGSPAWKASSTSDAIETEAELVAAIYYDQAAKEALPLENTMPEGEMSAQILQRVAAGGNAPARHPEPLLSQFAHFVETHYGALSDAKIPIGPLAANGLPSGAVHEAGLRAADDAGAPWIRRCGDWSTPPLIRTFSPPCDLVDTGLSIGWRFELEKPAGTGINGPPTAAAASLRIYQIALANGHEELLHSIPLTSEELKSCGFLSRSVQPHTLVGDGSMAFLDRSLWNLNSGERVAVLPETVSVSRWQWAFSQNALLGFAYDQNNSGRDSDLPVVLVDMCSLTIVAEMPYLKNIKEPRSIALSGDGRLGAIGHYSGIEIIDLVKRKPLLHSSIQGYKSSDLVFSNSMRHLAFGFPQENTGHWKVSLYDLRDPRKPIACVSQFEEIPLLFSPDDRLLLTQSGALYDARPDTMPQQHGEMRRLARLPMSVYKKATAFSPCGRYLLNSGQRLYDLIDLKPESDIQWSSHVHPVISRDGTQVLLAAADNSVHWRNFCADHSKRIFMRPDTEMEDAENSDIGSGWRCDDTPQLTWIGASADFRTAVLVYDDGIFYQILLANGSMRRVNCPQGICDILSNMWFVDEDQALLNGTHEEAPAEKRLSHPDTELYWARRKRGEIKLPEKYGISQSALSPCGRFLATARWGEYIRIWSVASGQCTAKLPVRYRTCLGDGEVSLLLFCTDSESVIFMLSDGRIYEWRFREFSESKCIGKVESNDCSGVGMVNNSHIMLAPRMGQPFISQPRPAWAMDLSSGTGPWVMANATIGVFVSCENTDDRHERLIVYRALDNREIASWEFGFPENDFLFSNLADSGAFVRLGHRSVGYYRLENFNEPPSSSKA